MAERLNYDELVSFKKLLMANEIYTEALVKLLLDKGVSPNLSCSAKSSKCRSIWRNPNLECGG